MSDKTEDLEIRLLLEALYQQYHYDFRSYAVASLKRRLRQALDHLGFRTFSAMQESLLHDPGTLPRLLAFLTIQVSEMFRDPAYFRAIREKLVAAKPGVASYRFQLAKSISDLGSLRRVKGDIPGAIAFLQQAQQSLERLIRDDPDVPLYRIQYS